MMNERMVEPGEDDDDDDGESRVRVGQGENSILHGLGYDSVQILQIAESE